MKHKHYNYNTQKIKFMAKERLPAMNQTIPFISFNLSLFHPITTKLLHTLRFFLSLVLFFLRHLPSLTLFPPPPPPLHRPVTFSPAASSSSLLSPTTPKKCGAGDTENSSIGRALSQILAMVTEVPVSSRKYETVRNLAEKLIEENLSCEALRNVNRVALSASFERTVAFLEDATSKQLRGRGGGDGYFGRLGSFDYGGKKMGMGWAVNAVRSFGEGALNRLSGSEEEASRLSGLTPEKFAAELLWLAEKMGDCGIAEEAVRRWGSASGLASLALSTEPRLQVVLIKISALLLKHAREMGGHPDDDGEEEKSKIRCDNNIIDQNGKNQRQGLNGVNKLIVMKKMLVTWLPFLCKASNGAEEGPALSSVEKREAERVIEENIEMLREVEEKEQVLALWLHHFISCPSSDWPNLHACYSRWCHEARNLLADHQSYYSPPL